MTLPPAYFDDLYDRSPDPWGFEDRWYEKRKRALTLALLPAQRYGTAFEPGCSVGVLTHDLAARCDRLLAIDISPAAVARARDRCAGLSHVRVECADIADAWPEQTFDLVVLSEVLYYFSSDRARGVARLAAASAHTLVSVHWRHPVADYPLSGDNADALLATAADGAGLRCVGRYGDEDLLAGIWTRDRASVAHREGLQ